MRFQRSSIWKAALLLGCVGGLGIIPDTGLWQENAEAFQLRRPPAKAGGGTKPGGGQSSPSASRDRRSTNPPTNVKVSPARSVQKNPSLATRVGNALRNLFRTRATSRKEAPRIAGKQQPIGPTNQSAQSRYGDKNRIYQVMPDLYNDGNIANPLANSFGGQWNMPGANRLNYFGNNLTPNSPFYVSQAVPNGGAAYFRPMQNVPVSNLGHRYGIMAPSPGGAPQVWLQGAGFAAPNPALNNLPPRGIPASLQYSPISQSNSQYAPAPSRENIQRLPKAPIIYEALPSSTGSAKNVNTVQFAASRAAAANVMSGNRPPSPIIGPLPKPVTNAGGPNNPQPRPQIGPANRPPVPANPPPSAGQPNSNPPANAPNSQGKRPPPLPPKPKI